MPVQRFTRRLSSDKGPQLLERTRVYLSHMRLFDGKVWKMLVGLVTLIGGMVWGTGCGKLVAPVDTYGFVQAFSGRDEEGNEEPSKGTLSGPSNALVQSVLKAIDAGQWKEAHTHLEALRLQNDLNPRQRLETKSLHTAVIQQVDRGSIDTSA